MRQLNTDVLSIMEQKRKDALAGELKGRSSYHVAATAGLAPKWSLPAAYAEAAYYCAASGGNMWPVKCAKEVRSFILKHGREFHSAENFVDFLNIHRIEIL